MAQAAIALDHASSRSVYRHDRRRRRAGCWSMLPDRHRWRRNPEHRCRYAGGWFRRRWRLGDDRATGFDLRSAGSHRCRRSGRSGPADRGDRKDRGLSLLAVGWDASSNAPRAVSWLSSDGLTWTEHNIASVASGGNDTMATAVATTPDALRSPLVRSASETRAGLRYGSRATGRIGSAHRRPFHRITNQ